MHEGILLGGVAAACLGVGDFLARGVTHHVGWKRTLLWLQLASVVPLTLVALAITGPVAFSGETLFSVAGLGVLNFVGAVGLYRSFATGLLSIVSPVASTFAVVTVGLALVAGQAPESSVLLGLALTLVGLGTASAVPRGESRGESRGARLGAGVGWALISSLGFGATFFALDAVAAQLGPIWPIAGMRIVAITLTAGTLARWPEPARPGLPWRPILAVALLDSAGLVAFTAGTLEGNVAVVAVIASSFSAITVVLAQLRLRERLAHWQWLGVALIIAGVAYTTYFSRAP